MTEISVGGLGVTALDIHAKGQKHSLKCPAAGQSKITFTPTENENEKQMKDPNKENSKVQATIDSLLIKDNTVKAEIRWALESLMSNYSYNSCSCKSELFSAMFSDSDIAEQFSMGKTKCAYHVTHGIAPYFKSKFIESSQLLLFHSVSFDESYNDAIKRGQMDLHIRYWDSETDRVRQVFLWERHLQKMYLNILIPQFKL